MRVFKRHIWGGEALTKNNQIPGVHTPIFSGVTGYVQHIDMPHLYNIARKNNAVIYVLALPGKFLDEGVPLAAVTGVKEDSILQEIRKGFITGSERSFRQDPRFGIAVLHEIACRALSPAVNDPGTAIQVIGSGVRILNLWSKRSDYTGPSYEPDYPGVFVPPLEVTDLFEDFFPPISRDGASNLEVNLRLQRAYQALIRSGDKDLQQAAYIHSALSLKRALGSLALDEDKAKLEESLIKGS